jgi:hypothetical protein
MDPLAGKPAGGVIVTDPGPAKAIPVGGVNVGVPSTAWASIPASPGAPQAQTDWPRAIVTTAFGAQTLPP